ncbi:MAG: hypothetical protein J6R08_06420 [Opitutales bacterium]|nr:hypothetical protein [Opitutales bacterium]
MDKKLKRQNSQLAEIELSVKAISESFEKDKKFLENVNGDLKSAAEIFASAQKRFEFADKINAKLNDLAAKNPGDRYQDRNYGNYLSNNYLNAKEKFKLAQNRIARLLVESDIANPRIRGISSMMALSRSFLSRAEDEININSENLAALSSEYKALESGAFENLKELNLSVEKLRSVKMKFLSEYMKLLSIMGSQDMIFKENPNMKNIYVEHIGKMGVKPDCVAFEAAPANANPFGSASNSDEVARSASHDTLKKAKTLSSSVKFDNVRVEFLEIGKNLSDLTREIEESSMLLNAVADEAESTIASIRDLEASAKAVLQKSISLSTNAQLLNSDVAIYKSELAVIAAQFEVSVSNIKTMLGNFISDCNLCSEKTSEIENLLSE